MDAFNQAMDHTSFVAFSLISVLYCSCAQEARALLGRLEYQRGNYDAALQVFQGIDIKVLMPRMINSITERTRPRKPHSKGDNVRVHVFSLHSVSLILEAILLKARSLKGLGRYTGIPFFSCSIIFSLSDSVIIIEMNTGDSVVIIDSERILRTHSDFTECMLFKTMTSKVMLALVEI